MTAKSPLDSAMQAIVAAMPGLSEKDIAGADFRQLIQGMRRAPVTAPGDQGLAEREISIPTRHGSVRTYLYRPVGSEALPVLINLHGGGWVGGTIEQDHPRCRKLSRDARCLVVSIDYSLAPERQFPVALDESEDVVRWIAEEGRSLGGDAGRFAFCGSSSGGAIAAALSQRLARSGGPLPVAQVLTYPVCDSSGEHPSWLEFGSGYLLSADMMRWFWSLYAPNENQRLDGEAAPLRAADLSGAIPTLIVTAECDILRDEAEAYAARLREAGARTVCKRYPGVIHGFISVAPDHPASIDALDRCSHFLRAAFDAAVNDQPTNRQREEINDDEIRP